MELTPAEAASLNALIDQCLKILKESNERSEQIYAEIARSRAERQSVIRQVMEMLNVEKTL
jgi:hypothetical protein